ncbi:hypothetical protein LX16_3200 [Stackebrandtia albiflava]|uniref:Uncharacterized protein n=1 Tax=Stackebrandtia albiflava TaxID=406432 RepID=A0A562V3N8_9ACTN|nr:hypothetical protein [Stackebrandtia albiflava]TWJ12442.1 hypothetical protein LX16_3200 [Stackebrandtia albiflava]
MPDDIDAHPWLAQDDTPLHMVVGDMAAGDWDALLSHLRERPTAWRPPHGRRVVPATHSEVDVREDHAVAESDAHGGLTVWYFEDELIVSSSPAVTDAAGVSGVLGFMRELGDVLARDVVMTPEWEHGIEIYRYHRDTGTITGPA